MKASTFNPRRWLAVAGLLCAAGAWGDPVPTGPVSEYLVHCHSWMSFSAKACAGLADRLAAVDRPTRAQRLALHMALGTLTRSQGREADDCPGLAAIAADHPDYAYALYFLSYCVPKDAGPGEESSVALLKRAAEIEPNNYLVLQRLIWEVEGLHPESPRLPGRNDPDADPATLAAWREAMYEAGKARAVWWREVLADAEPDDPPAERNLQATVWLGLLRAGRGIYAAALRDGDLAAAEAIQARLRRDLGLDALDYGAKNARASLALACQPALYGSLGLEDACLSGIEKVAGLASDDGLPLPDYVLKVMDHAIPTMRHRACAVSQGSAYGGMVVVDPGGCLPEVTETHSVSRLRAVLERHDGVWSSEHHRVHAQSFLGDAARRDG